MQPDTRIYVELLPDERACDYLHTLVEALNPHVKGRAVDPSKWHVTILHFGIAEHVYYDIQRVLPNISKTTFYESLEQYIAKAKKSLPPPTELLSDDLALFGIKENVLVLNFEPNELVQQVHAQALHDIEEFLRDCGVTDTHDFMKSSVNFKWALELRPHITLFRGVVRYDAGQIQPSRQLLKFNSADIHGI